MLDKGPRGGTSFALDLGSNLGKGMPIDRLVARPDLCDAGCLSDGAGGNLTSMTCANIGRRLISLPGGYRPPASYPSED